MGVLHGVATWDELRALFTVPSSRGSFHVLPARTAQRAGVGTYSNRCPMTGRSTPAPNAGVVVPSRQTIRQAAKVRRCAYCSARKHYNALRRCARLLRRDMMLAAGRCPGTVVA